MTFHKMPTLTNSQIIEEWSALPPESGELFGDEGDFARQALLNPTIFGLLGDIAGQTILDAGCGNGYLSRLMSKKGAKVVGLEPAAPLIQYAIQREQQEPLGIEYVQADLAYWETEQRFDAIVANMVLMDIPDYEAALDRCFEHLGVNGRFIFSITHPCFEASDSEFRANGYITVKDYFQPYVIQQGISHRVHRPLSHYFQALLVRGGRIDAIIEPQLTPEQAQYPLEQERNLHIPSFIVIQVSKL